MELGEEMVSPSPERVIFMTVGPVSGMPASAGPAHVHTPLARWAVALAAVAAVMITVALVVFGFVGEGLGVLFSGGVMASFAAFAMGVVAMIKHERWAMLFIPLTVFPAALAVLVLGEMFWWE